MPALTAHCESWPIVGGFAISRGTKTEAVVVVVELSAEGVTGRGESVPYSHYGESVESVLGQIDQIRSRVEAGANRGDLLDHMPPGAARNAIDCALWDLEAKTLGERAWELANLREPKGVRTAYTLSLDEPDRMAEKAREYADWPLLKVKLGPGDIDQSLEAIRAVAPEAMLIVDANEGWTIEILRKAGEVMSACNVSFVEQPLPASKDEALRDYKSPVPICADESFHGVDDFDAVEGKYDILNIKLDKTGGLTDAMRIAKEAKARGYGIMVGCMVGTSLAMAPAMLLESFADYVDLDGPLLLARDREPGIAYQQAEMLPPSADLWG